MERENWEIAGAGYGLHWPDIDEDLLKRGKPASWSASAPVEGTGPLTSPSSGQAAII